jgi:hypothetical protein
MRERKRIKNRYKICGDYTIIYLDRRDGSQVETLIDTEDLKKVIGFKHKWHYAYEVARDLDYVAATIYLGMIDGKSKNTTIKLSNYIMDCPEGFEVDHEDHKGLNNRKYNLRVVDKKHNGKNRKSKNSNNSSGYRNVSYRNGVPIVQLQDENGKNHIWDGFGSVEEAGLFAEKMRKAWYGDFAGNS